MTSDSLAYMSDRDLLTEVKGLAQNKRRSTVDLIATLVEHDVRRLYLGEDAVAGERLQRRNAPLGACGIRTHRAARAARRFPVILDLLADGSVTLTTVCLLASHMTRENHREVLDAARHKSKREVELLVSMLAPRPAVPASVRKLPGPKPTDAPCAHDLLEGGCEDRAPLTSLSVPALPKRQAIVAPLAPERFRVQFTASRETHDKLRLCAGPPAPYNPRRRPSHHFRSSIYAAPDSPGENEAPDEEDTQAPRSVAAGSRHIPATVQREVWKRDGGQCAFVGAGGRCTERGFLELDDVVPFAVGGQARLENIQHSFRAHNVYEADCYFGSNLVREGGGMYDYSVPPGPDRVGSVANRNLT